MEFSGDHHGSLFIQAKIERAKTEEKDVVFREIHPNALPLMKDVFGNYVLQKYFEHGDSFQKRALVNAMTGHAYELAKHTYGCRVIQTALSQVLVEQQASIVSELEAHVMELINNENGNHVIQVAIKVVPMKYLQPMIDQFYTQIEWLARHRYGCRIMQRLLEACKPPALTHILHELHQISEHIIPNMFGNYVPQHILEHGKPGERKRIIEVVQTRLVEYSKEKYASNVVEKCVRFGGDDKRHEIMMQLLEQDARDGRQLLPFLIRDPFANYVVQSLLEYLNDRDYVEFVSVLGPALDMARSPEPNKPVEMVSRKMQRLVVPRPGWNAAPSTGASFGSFGHQHHGHGHGHAAPAHINTSFAPGQGQAGPGPSGTTPTPPLTAAGTESPLEQAFPNVPEMNRPDALMNLRDWRKGSDDKVETAANAADA